MFWIFDNILLFFISTPLGLVALFCGLVYGEYLLGKRILADDPVTNQYVHTIGYWSAKHFHRLASSFANRQRSFSKVKIFQIPIRRARHAK